MAEDRRKSLPEKFQASLSLEGNKPDTKEFFPDLGSPVSPLRGAVPANTSSSSSSSGSFSSKTAVNSGNATASKPRSPTAAGFSNRRNHSGELSGSSDTSPIGRALRPGHQRSGSGGPLIYSGGGGGGGGGISSTASSPATNVLPAGNICPSGRIGKMGPARTAARTDVLGSGTGNYGHGSVMRSSAAGVRAPTAVNVDPEEVTRAGNEMYKKGQMAEALRHYDKAVAMCPDNAACHGNRAAALAGLGRLGEAVIECEAAVRLDPAYVKAHQRLGTLYLRLGQVEDARKHLLIIGHHPNSSELQRLETVERHIAGAADARKIGDWKNALRESDAAIAAGSDSSPLIIASRAEALIRLHQLEEADSTVQKATTLVASSPSALPQSRFLGMHSESYFHVVRAQVEMALGRFDNAVALVEKARLIDPKNLEVSMILNNVKAVARARNHGNELFKTGSFAEACVAYGEGLKFDPSNSVLYCNRAACRSKLGQWDKALEDCNEALRIQPNYTKALLRRAASYSKLERWAEAVRDYEILRKELPDDKQVAEDLFHAQVALKTSRGEEISNMKFGGEVEEISSMEQFQAAISLPGVSVVHFMTAANPQCKKITPFVDGLCSRFPSINFLKVDINESTTLAKAESIRIVPTFKIYKNGTRVKEMICPTQQVLEYSVRHYSL